MTKIQQVHTISLGARLLVSKGNDPPFVQIPGQNKETLIIHTNRGDITFNFAPGSWAYTQVYPRDERQKQVVRYNPSNVPFYGMIQRQISLGTLDAFERESKLHGYEKFIKEQFEQSQMAFLYFIRDNLFDRIRIYHQEEHPGVEFAYKQKSLRGRAIVTTSPTMEEIVDSIIFDVPRVREDYIQLEIKAKQPPPELKDKIF